MIDEKDLIRRLKNESTKQSAFRELLGLYQKRLYIHIRTLVLSHDDTDDVLQETFIKVFQNIGKFKGDSQLFSWMYRIATNQALDFLKNKKKENKASNIDLEDNLVQSLQSDPLFDGDKAEIILYQAIDSLPEKQQLVFKMKYLEELDYNTISEILGTSVGALKASYHHATKKIEDFINQH